MFTSSRLARPLVYAYTAAFTCGTAFYAFSSDSNDLPARVHKPEFDKSGRVIPPTFPRVKSRQEQISALKRSGLKSSNQDQAQERSSNDDDIYDLLIIGGGATGTGIALDAVTRGLKVALIERDDFSSGASSKSTKLIHGGVRYLEKAVWNLDYEQFKLVQEALRERKHFTTVAPHLASWLPVMLPLQSWLKAPYFWAGTKCYDLLAGSRGFKGSSFLSKSAALEAFPMQKKDGLVGALVYYDGQQNDSRMNISLAMTASLYGATILNHVQATELQKDSNGKICGARVRNTLPNRATDNDDGVSDEFVVRARGVINATGPYVDAIRKFDKPEDRDIVVPSSGVHIVLPAYFSSKNMGLLDPSTSDGRVMFLLPWEGRTLVGTTDSPSKVSKNPVAGDNDVDWILNEIRGYLAPGISLQRSDVLAAWSGIRPLVQDPKATNIESLVRNHLVTVSDSGLLTCAGGKWTTYRQMAEDAVDKAIEVFQLKPNKSNVDFSSTLHEFNDVPIVDGSCQTQHVRLIGAHGFHDTLAINLIQHYSLDEDIAAHLVHSYGDRAWEVASLSSKAGRLVPEHCFVDGEILHAMKNEAACSSKKPGDFRVDSRGEGTGEETKSNQACRPRHRNERSNID
ncbi:mitochondrial glycerol-3-phosphate dehydrogenase [Cadophora gregata]|uniref:mitochondrial glycerol-3-phosphate dehydrogenase n=1 Tax=Cadophora gregata TaxID=51156 RepID=UPI0026DB4A0E|nr:mitochondrial glycerol-3-phosphate dehydrogenase [Cadophora gregata]KAK0110030.1 mitochondrial glycerol-3-phosphate dehydrogenase [Cadophora gregata]KAK0110347.1 mitochondrial glycerol-3-phosphate dehydrogenase [Cadophora gregata f. sp. sojae]